MTTNFATVYQSHDLLCGSAPEGLLKHLLECMLQPVDVQSRAQNDPSCKKGCQGVGNSPSHSQMSMVYRNPSLADLNRSPSGPSASLALSQFGPPDTAPRLGCFHPYLPPGTQASSSDSASLSVPFQVPHLSCSRSLFNQHLSVERGSTLSWVSTTDSITPSDSVSWASSHSGDTLDRWRSSI